MSNIISLFTLKKKELEDYLNQMILNEENYPNYI